MFRVFVEKGHEREIGQVGGRDISVFYAIEKV